MSAAAAFLPMDRRRALARGDGLPDRTTGAALFADISGFTRLAEALTAELGADRGADELIVHVNRVYDAIVGEIHRRRGSVIAFSGDAITCWFDGDGGRSATSAALAMQRAMAGFGELATPGRTRVTLAIKVAVVHGAARRFTVGHPDFRLLDALAGATIDRMAAAEQHARSGEVVVAEDVAEQLAGDVEIASFRGDVDRVAVITSLANPTSPDGWDGGVADVADAVAETWIPSAIRERIAEGHHQFLAELRPATAVFLRFAGISFDADDGAGDKLDAYIRWVQGTVDRFGGTLIDVTLGDKGAYVYACFGAPIAREDDGARAVAAAVALLAPPPSLDFVDRTQIGVSRGISRAGMYGATQRHTYGVLGRHVNIAARLMMEAQPGRVLVSAPVVEVAGARWAFQELPPVSLKGVTDPIPIFAVLGPRRETSAEHRRASPLVGRGAEWAALDASLIGLGGGQGGVVVIEGEAGAGKTRLVAELLARAKERRIKTWCGAGDAIERATPYHALRGAFLQALDLDSAEEAIVRARCLALLANDAALLERAPLLSGLLPVGLADNDLTREMTGEARANSTREVLIGLLRRSLAVATRSLAGSLPPPSGLSGLLIVEDAHWVDATSWAFLGLARRELPSLLFVLATRPMATMDAGPERDDLRAWMEAADTRLIALAPLTHDAVVALACQRLGVARLPARLAELIAARGEGNPLFCEQIAYALRDSGKLRVVDGECILDGAAENAPALSLSGTVQGVITSRIDQLPAGTQLSLKVGGVLGRTFAASVVEEIYPVVEERPRVRAHLGIASDRELTAVESPDPDLAYLFRHALTQDVAYGLLLFDQRKQLHRAAAESIERRHASDLHDQYALLAHHWARAEDAARELEYAELAGTQAVHDGHFDVAIRSLGRALSIAEGRPAGATIDGIRLARLHEQLARAHLSRGDDVASREHAERALALLDMPMPAAPGATARRLFAEVLRHVFRLLVPGRPRLATATPDPRALIAARAFMHLSQVYYFQGAIGLLMVANLSGFREARTLGPSPELSRFYAILSAALFGMGIPKLALRYENAARAAALDSLAADSWMLLATAAASLGRLPWPELTRRFREAAEGFGRLGNVGDRMSTLSAMTLTSLTGAFTAGLEVADELLQIATRVANPIYEAAARAARAFCLLGLGRTEEADAALERTNALAPALAKVPVQLALLLGELAVTKLRLRDEVVALAHADAAVALFDAAMPFFVGAPAFASAGAAEVYLALWEGARRTGANTASLEQKARRAGKLLRACAQTTPAAWARVYLVDGKCHALSGHPRRARAAFRRARATAVALDMPYDEALAEYELGRCEGTLERGEHLARALAIFTRLGAAYDVGRVSMEIAASPAASRVRA